MRRFLAALAMLLLAIAGCRGNQASGPLTKAESEDPEMKQAVERARSTLDRFIAALGSPTDKQSQFSIRVRFADADHEEALWLLPVTYDGQKFEGKIDSDPESVTSVKVGEKVTVEPAQVSDWMYVDDGRLVGGYTVRLVHSRFSDSEREAFDKMAPFIVD